MAQRDEHQEFLRGHTRGIHAPHGPRDVHGMPLLQLTVDEDIVLRVFSEEDAPALFALTDQNRAYLRTWLPWLDSTRTVLDTQAFILDELTRYTSNRGFSCGIWYRGQLAGSIGFHDINWKERTVEIGYWLGAAFQGRGIMTRACRDMVDYAFHTLHLVQVQIRCASENTRSRAIPQRLGFQETGFIQQGEWLYDHFVDLVVYSMHAEAWPNR